MKFSKILLLVPFILLSIACQKSNSQSSVANQIDETIITKVTKESFIGGKKFCQLYVNNQDASSKEYGVWVKVPKSYEDSSLGKMEIYAYTRKPFNPQLPSYVLVDGGPGQNTHQTEDILSTEFNQINFDQRGVGCSTPETWEEYANHKIYSSKNTIKDMEEIRKQFGIDNWSVYGISYGTIPATMYAANFKGRANSLVLEGVVGSVEKLSRIGYRAEKWNKVLNTLNSKQREAFNNLMANDPDKKLKVILSYFNQAGYKDAGYRRLKDKILDRLFPPEGGFDENFYQDLKAFENKKSSRYSTPQQPGAVDDNILTIFYCKELKAFEKDGSSLNYNESDGFFEKVDSDQNYWKSECEKQQITTSDQDTYFESDYPVYSPVYYFQGSHDAATVAEGALHHWQQVPRKQVYFLLALRGGHNPGLSKVYSESDEIKNAHKSLYQKAFSSVEISKDFVAELNFLIQKNEKNENLKLVTWELFLKPSRHSTQFENHLEGIRKITH